MPVSRTAQCSRTLARGSLVRPNVDEHLAALGELDGVADQVDEDLPQAAGIADQQSAGTSAATRKISSSPFSRGPDGQHPRRVADDFAQVEGDVLQLQLAGLDLGEIEDVVDQVAAGSRPIA